MLSFASSLSPDSDAFIIFVTEKYVYKDKRDVLSSDTVQKINSFLSVLKVKKKEEDISSIDIETGNLVWQIPTQSSTIYENYFTIKNSDLISANNTIYFSNNRNEFFAIDERNGAIKWKQNLNSNLRPTFADGILFTVTLEGYLVAIDSRNGNVVASFPVTEGDEIILSTDKGRVIRCAVKEIRSAGRNTQGVRIFNLSGEEKVVSAIKIDDNFDK